MPISDKYDKLRDRNQKVTEYQHYPKWVKDDHGKDTLVQDQYEHRELAPKDYKHDPYTANYRKDEDESRANVLEIKARAAPPVVKPPQKLDAKVSAAIPNNKIITNDEHS